MDRVVVVGASIAGVTAAGTLRGLGWRGSLVLLSEEQTAPYSRVPLSKGVLAGTQDLASTRLAALPDDVDVRLGTRAAALQRGRRVVQLDDGTEGARARRIAAEGQAGELVVRTLADAAAIARRVEGARSAIVVGAGFLGMEVASTLTKHGLNVVLVDRDPPLRRLTGPWIADLVVARASAAGVRLLRAANGVELIGDPVDGVQLGPGERIHADLVVSAVGDLPNVEWLESSGLGLDGGLIVDSHCRAGDRVVAAGDVTTQATEPGVLRRTPHWSNAVAQGVAAGRTLLDPDGAAFTPDHYFWTEQFGLKLNIAGRLPIEGVPRTVDGDPDAGSALVEWRNGHDVVAAASINYRIPVARLKARLG